MTDHVLRMSDTRLPKQVIGSDPKEDRTKTRLNDVLKIHSDGVVVKTSDSQSRETVLKFSCCRFEAGAILFTPHCLSSLSCINEYLAMNCSRCVNVGV